MLYRWPAWRSGVSWFLRRFDVVPPTGHHREAPLSENREKTAEARPPQQVTHERTRVDLTAAVSKFAPGWMAKDCGAEMSPGLRDENGEEERPGHPPLSETMPCILGRRVDILPDRRRHCTFWWGTIPRGLAFKRGLLIGNWFTKSSEGDSA